MSVWAMGLALATSGETAYPRVPDMQVGAWTISDGNIRCEADFNMPGKGKLHFDGSSYDEKGEPDNGSMHTKFWPEGLPYPKKEEFPVVVTLGSRTVAMDGVGVQGFRLDIWPKTAPSLFERIGALPDRAAVRFTVFGKTMLETELTDTRAAYAAMQRCVAFITAQRRPGTRDGPPAPVPPPPPKIEEPKPIKQDPPEKPKPPPDAMSEGIAPTMPRPQ